LQSGKDVFVEKPLALDLEGLEGVVRAFRSGQGRLMVGFNRRFSPFSVRAKEWFGTPTTPVVINCRVNAGFVPKDSWIQDPEQGGGRIVGEACHFIDLVQYLAGSLPDTVYAQAISGNLGAYQSEDNVAITLKMTDGSVASVTYVASGDKAYPRERVEMFGGNSVCVIDNFKSLAFTSDGRRRKMSRLNVDRGHEAELATFFGALKNGTPMPVDFREYVFTTLATFSALESMRGGVPVRLDTSVVGLAT
jgi:polar amino acid transport system substrate-binding protein